MRVWTSWAFLKIGKRRNLKSWNRWVDSNENLIIYSILYNFILVKPCTNDSKNPLAVLILVTSRITSLYAIMFSLIICSIFRLSLMWDFQKTNVYLSYPMVDYWVSASNHETIEENMLKPNLSQAWGVGNIFFKSLFR